MSSRRMSRRAFLAKAAAAAAGLTLGGLGVQCGATPTPKVVEVTRIVAGTPVKETVIVEKVVEVPPKAEKIFLRVQTLGGLWGEKAQKFCAQYMELHPNVTVKNEIISWGDLRLKSELLYGTKNLQDIAYGWCWLAPVGCYKGWYLPIDDLLATTDAVPDYDDFYQSVVESVKWEGKTYGIIDWMVPGSSTIVYNRHIFKEMGVSVPDDREVGALDVWELQDMALRLTNKEKGIFGLTGDYGRRWGYETWTRCWGRPEYGKDGDIRGWIVTPGGKSFHFADNEFAKTWYKDWYRPLLEARAVPKAEDQVEGGLFYAGKQAIKQYQVQEPRRTFLRVDGRWDYSVAEDWFMMPRGPEGRIGTATQSQLWHVTTQSKFPEEALRVVGLMTGVEAGLWECLASEGNSGRASVWTDPKVVEFSPNYLPTHKLLMSGIVEPSPDPWNLRYAEMQDAFGNLFTPLRDGTKTWEEQAPEMQKEQDRIFAEPMIPK